MLTPNDVHQIIGLLSYSFSSEDVDIELGSMVLDKTTNTRRDVDITISFKDESGKQVSLTGLEVKDHTRPLDVSHVEQLAIKLKDMPSVNTKGIVSSSGYTRPAMKKAKAHGIRLYRFEDWDYKNSPLDHVHLEHDMPFVSTQFSWQKNTNVTFLLDGDKSLYSDLKIRKDTHVYFAEPKEGDNLPKNLGQLARNLSSSKLPDKFTNDKRVANNVEYNLALSITISDKPYILKSGKKIFIPKAVIKGPIKKLVKTHYSTPKALREQNKKTPLAACLLYELDDNQLLGLSFYHRKISFINIPIKNRNLNKIKQMKLSSSEAPEQALSPSVSLGCP